MAEQQTINYAPQWNNMTVDNFWSTAVAYDLFPSTDETEQRPLKEFLIKFSIPTFIITSGTGRSGHRKKALRFQEHSLRRAQCLSPKIHPLRPRSHHPSQQRAIPLVSSGTVPDPQELERDIQLANTGLPSTLDEGTCKTKPLLESTATPPKDSGGNIQPIDRDITSTTSDEGTAKTTPRPEGLLGDKDSGCTRPNVRAFLLPDDESKKDILEAGEEIDEEPQVASIAETHHQSPPPQVDKPQSSHAPSTEASDTDSSSDDILRKYDNILPLTERQLVKYPRKMSNALFIRISEDNWEKHEEVAINYVDLKASVDDYYDENIAHRDQTDKLVEAFMSSLDKSSNTISDLYKGLNIIELLKEIKNAVKDDSAHALKQDKELAAWAKSSTNMAWNLGSRLSGLERAQNHIQSRMSSLKEDTHSIKNMMTEMYEVFKGQSSGSVTPTLALTHIPANVEGETTTNTATEDPPSHTEGETGEPKRAILISIIQPTQAQPITTIITHPESSQVALRIIKGKRIATRLEEDSLKKLVPASTIEQMDKEELIKKAEEEARLLAISKPEVIKVVQEEAEKIRLDPKKIASAKVGEKLKKAQDAEHQVLKREHTEKVRKSLKLRKHKFESYMWTINNRLKSETITDIKIHPKTKPVVITVYRGTDARNFDVHRPFAFGAFSISELDELREIIPKKKNAVSALLAPAPEQASSQSSRKKRKHMELEPETKIPRLECNRALPEHVPFVNNMVIEEPEHGIFFTDEFAASMVKSPENARFSLKLKKLIAEHPYQEKLKSKKVKLEALGYEMN
ncbi:hypothetical protein Tco_0099865 [Tanacetum coccineum]